MRRVFLVLSTVLLAILLLVSGSLLVRNAWSEAPTGLDGDSTMSTAFTYQGSLTDDGRPKANMILYSCCIRPWKAAVRPDLATILMTICWPG